MCGAEALEGDLEAEFNRVAIRLREVLDDLTWRKADVEGEERKLADLRAQAAKGEEVDVASQAIVTRVLREVLDAQLEEADRLEKQLLDLKARLEGSTPSEPKPRRGRKRG